jgi:predicted metal-dependent hydrolase
MDTLWSTEEWEHGQPAPAPTLVADAEPTAESVARMPVDVVRSSKRRKSVSARVVDGRIVVRMPQWMTKAQEAEYVEAMVAKLVRQHTAHRVDLVERAAELARRYRLPNPGSIRFVGNQASRWGSCSPASGEIRISDRIATFPGWVLDAVIVHELAHLVEANHSPAFHALADRYPKQERAYGFLLAMQLTDDDVDGY